MTQASPPGHPAARSERDAYRESGVDIAAGNAFVATIAPAAARTHRPGVLGGLGGFGGLFDLKAAGFTDPILVAATDGVGTKLVLAQQTGRHRGIGVDLVAMCVNDVVVQGAEPLFFLDYLATGRLEARVARAVVEGIADACCEVGCALLGGETAEMPGVYPPGGFDLAGFAVGAVERTRLLPRPDVVRPGDSLVAVASSGLHSNGFSLVRRVVTTAGADLDAPAPFDPERPLADALLTPTRLYGAAARTLRDTGASAIAHITGGGLMENLPRVLPPGLRARVDLDSWTLPAVFGWLAEAGGFDRRTLFRTFNAGIGLVAILPRDSAADAVAALARAGETAWLAGTLEADSTDSRSVVFEGGVAWPPA